MENLKNISFENCNVMVYVKTKTMKKFSPLSSLKNWTIAPNLMYARLIPFDKLDSLKEWANQFVELCAKENVSIQIRSAKDRKKVLHQVN